jgi:hypothetical protein
MLRTAQIPWFWFGLTRRQYKAMTGRGGSGQ